MCRGARRKAEGAKNKRYVDVCNEQKRLLCNQCIYTILVCLCRTGKDISWWLNIRVRFCHQSLNLTIYLKNIMIRVRVGKAKKKIVKIFPITVHSSLKFLLSKQLFDTVMTKRLLTEN